jgi:hypothetical protein
MNLLTRPHLTLYLIVLTLKLRVTSLFGRLIFSQWWRKWCFFSHHVTCGIPWCFLKNIIIMMIMPRMYSLKWESTWANPPKDVLILAIFALSYQSQWFQNIRNIIKSSCLKLLDHHNPYLWFKNWLAIIILFKNIGCRLL